MERDALLDVPARRSARRCRPARAGTGPPRRPPSRIPRAPAGRRRSAAGRPSASGTRCPTPARATGDRVAGGCAPAVQGCRSASGEADTGGAPGAGGCAPVVCASDTPPSRTHARPTSTRWVVMTSPFSCSPRIEPCRSVANADVARWRPSTPAISPPAALMGDSARRHEEFSGAAGTQCTCASSRASTPVVPHLHVLARGRPGDSSGCVQARAGTAESGAGASPTRERPCDATGLRLRPFVPTVLLLASGCSLGSPMTARRRSPRG